MPATELPPLPESPMQDANGNLNPEWRRFFTALAKIVRTLNV